MERINRSGAEISACGNYRFRLWRIWDEEKPYCLFIMHNPSTADAGMDDPTIRRCIAFAKSWGYGGMFVGNICPYRATDPKILGSVMVPYATYFENEKHVVDMARKCAMHVLAYGVPHRSIPIKESIGNEFEWHFLDKTKDGHPRHPLYLKKSLTPKSAS